MEQNGSDSSKPIAFISYCRDDEAQVTELADELELAGYDVWVDRKKLRPGSAWNQEIESAIDNADLFLVFLSTNSIHNWRVQQREINHALQKNEREKLEGWIIPVRLADCKVPQGLNDLHAIDEFIPGLWRAWVDEVRVPSQHNSGVLERLRTIPAGGKTLRLPVFFPSLSTAAKTTIGVQAHMELLLALGHPQFLVSAADIFFLRKSKQADSRRISELLTSARQKDQIVLLDSGNYEKYWQKLKNWNVNKFHEVLSYTPVTLAFCFDNLNPPESIAVSIDQIEESTLRDRRENELESMLPIVHARNPKDFPVVCRSIAERLQPILIGVPERELGAGIVERIKTIVSLRSELDATGHYYPIHLLGTGNPISLLAFFLAGADSFDGLEWCQTVVDIETARLHHLSHFDLFLHQSPFGSSSTSPAAKVLAHNLWFYDHWMKWLQNSSRQELLWSLEKFVRPQVWPKIKEALGGRYET